MQSINSNDELQAELQEASRPPSGQSEEEPTGTEKEEATGDFGKRRFEKVMGAEEDYEWKLQMTFSTGWL